MGKSLKMVLFAGIVLLVPNFASAAVIFQDNFDNCTSNCTAAQLAAPSGWSQWYGPNSATVGGVTHNPGEITAPGRGGGGKSFKTWRAGPNWEGYNGTFAYYFPGSHSEIYMRYYVKLPTGLDLSQCSSSNYLKMWRLNITGSAQEIYLNMNQNGGSLKNTATLDVLTNTHGWTTVLNHSDLAAIWDNNWHSWEWHVNLSTGVLELWIDGVRKYNGSGWNFGGGTFYVMQHFSMGNHASGCSWQSSWQAMDIDDFVLSTTYVGPDGSGGGTTPTDTTPPSVPSLTATAVSSSQINLSWTASTDSVGVTGYKIYRNGTYLTTTTSTSYNNTGLTGATSYSYRVSAIDAAGNESSQSTAKSVTTQTSSSGGGGNAFLSTTFNYGPCTQRGDGGQTSCASVNNDRLVWDWGGPLGTNYTQTTAAANYPGGGGGYGMRSWKGDGSNVLSGPIKVEFPSPQKEFWVRWYERWENGARWSDGYPGYTKSLYLRTGGWASSYAGFYGNGYRIYNQGSVGVYPSSSSGGWSTVYPGGVSDGSWHSYEVHMKMDTNSSDGIGRIWVDGKLVSNVTNVNWSNGDSASKNGVTWFDFQNNQASLANGRVIYVDTDDMVVYTSTPPNRDASGNPYIGPIGGSGGGGGTPSDTTAPSVPSLTATTISSSQINLSWTASTDNTGVTGYKVYRNGTYLTTTTSTSYSNTGLTSSTAYSYRVSAIDAAGNESSQSTAKSATTQAGTGGTDTTPPAVPTGLMVS